MKVRVSGLLLVFGWCSAVAKSRPREK